MTLPPRTEPGSRFGIRARLLVLLLPCLLGLLALDSWNDYRALRDLAQDAYDRVMLASAHALRRSVVVTADGTLQLDAHTAQSTARAVLDAIDADNQLMSVELLPRTAGQDRAAAVPAPRRLLGEADLPQPPVDGWASVDGLSTVWYDAHHLGHPVRVVALRGPQVDERGQPFDVQVQVVQPSRPRARAEADSLRQQLLRDARMVLMVSLLVWLGVTWSLKPLERLRESVIRRQGGVPEPLDVTGVPYEVSPLVIAVNAQVASYRELLDAQSQFLADASHQLRTPLAIMMTQAGVALREKDPARLQETLRAIRAQVGRSRRLCEQLLALVHASERTPPGSAPSDVDLNGIARDVVVQHLTLAHEKDQDLGWADAGHAVTAQADGAELYEVLANLVHNAIVHTPVGGRITVEASAADGQSLVEVRDDGPGIAPARRDEVFERFRQLAGTAGNHGAGLGLSIARAYARRNGGDVVLADAGPDGTGLRAILRLPQA
ncbi:sensor histidine kinase [Variovorax ginsengisoli]|uniref:histidine kinase n=1 Tax=Variovorax ginsengisoli TaxID=363844 RepID=A0ABT9SDR5_9BURK|nr:sensor histidine kinase [Variovorax ginsengisoli]MDP9902503.1 two-component system sensor histidine kinase TctE [Variovorax ginsengisoli]